MLIILEVVLAVVTFPGVVVEACARQFVCRVMEIKVKEVAYFQMVKEGSSGFVKREGDVLPGQALGIYLIPMLVNLILGVVFVAGASIRFVMFGMLPGNATLWVFVWLGISMLMHMIPSPEEGAELLNAYEAQEKSPGALAKLLAGFSALPAGVLIDILLAVLVMWGIPYLFIPFVG